MPRPLRIDYLGAFHHVTMRGVGKQPIVLDDDDRQAFVKRLAELPHRWGLTLHAYCLMTNHYHLEVESAEANLSRGMQWLNHNYSAFFNWRHERCGHLFEGRFRSALVEAETHLQVLTRYVHMNPVRAGLVKEPEDYVWSSYRAYIGQVRRPSWLETQETLRQFGRTAAEQLRSYRDFVEDRVAGNPLQVFPFGALVGSPAFVDWVKEKIESRASEDASDLSENRSRPTLEEIAAAVSRYYSLPLEKFAERGGKRNEARDMAIYLSRERSGRPNSEIGAYYGGISGAAVSSRSSIIQKKSLSDKVFHSRIIALSRSLTPSRP